MKRLLWFMVVGFLAFSLVACGAENELNLEDAANGNEVIQGTEDTVDSDNNESEESEGSEAKQTVYPLTVTDASGLEMTFEQAPERIVSLSPSETEVLFALGLGDFIVGVTDWCDFPIEAQSKPKMGGLEGNVEAVIASEPDLIMAGLSLNKSGAMGSYRDYGLNVFTVEPKTIDQAMERILQVGVITDRQAQAEQVVAQMRQEKQKVVDSVAGISADEKKKVYIEFSEGFTVGKGEYMDELITLAGGVNVAGEEEGWISISEEKIIQDNPDVILHTLAAGNLDSIIKSRSGWGEIAAIKNDRIIGIEDNLLSRPGPRITQGLLEVAKAIYPELVK